MRRLLSLLLLLTALCAGCNGDSDGEPTEEPETPAETKTEEPLTGSVFNKDEVREIYGAYMLPERDPKRREILRKHKLIDGANQPVPRRRKAFDNAMQRYAKEAKTEWSEVVEQESPGPG